MSRGTRAGLVDSTPTESQRLPTGLPRIGYNSSPESRAKGLRLLPLPVQCRNPSRSTSAAQGCAASLSRSLPYHLTMGRARVRALCFPAQRGCCYSVPPKTLSTPLQVSSQHFRCGTWASCFSYNCLRHSQSNWSPMCFFRSAKILTAMSPLHSTPGRFTTYSAVGTPRYRSTLSRNGYHIAIQPTSNRRSRADRRSCAS